MPNPEPSYLRWTILLWLLLWYPLSFLNWGNGIPCQPGQHRYQTWMDRFSHTYSCEASK